MKKLNKIIAVALAFVLVIAALPVKFVSADSGNVSEKFPYMIFASSCEKDAVKLDVQNGCINGNIGTNGTIALNANMNVNGTKTENAGQAMIIALKKLQYKYFSNEHVRTILSDYVDENINVNIINPLSVLGSACFTGNISQNGAVMASNDVMMNGGTINVTDSVICSETGSIDMEGTGVNLSGLIYAPYGEVSITAQTINLNNVVIIAEKVTLQGDVLNANYNAEMAELIGTETECELRLWTFGTYSGEDNSILIKWMSTVPNGTFEVFVSDDNESYTSIGVSADGQEYKYADFEEFDTKYIRVTETTYYGESISAVSLVAVKTDQEYEIRYLDTDEDGIPDIFEEQMGTDCFKADTDGDGLTDYQEVYITDTDPLVSDSVVPDTSDADADSDGDGISNMDEIICGTDPLCADTDGDGISDEDELYMYGTNPLKPDTDSDGINDGDELKLGLAPENPETFGLPDAEYRTAQKIMSDSAALSDINTDGSPYKLSIDITAAGYVEGVLEAHETSYAKAIENEAMLGIAPELMYANEESIETVTLKFEISEEYLENTLNLYPQEEELAGIKRLNVFKYFEDLHMLLPIETKFDVENNILYTEVDELGTYCVMDLEIWLNSFVPLEEDQPVPALMPLTEEIEAEDDSRMECAEEFAAEDAEIDLENTQDIPMLMSLKTSTVETPLDVVFILQTAGNSESYYELQKQMIRDVSDRLFETYSDVRICVIQYKENNAGIVGSYTYPVWQTEAAHMSTVLDKLTYEATSAYCNRGAAFSLMLGNVDFRDNAGKFVFQIMNGNTMVGSGYFSQLDACAKCDINYSEIFPSGWHYKDSSYAAKVERAIAATNGLNLTFSSQTKTIVYNHITEHLAPPQLAYIVKLPTNYREIHLRGILDPDNHVNSDEDSLTDWEEVDTTKVSWDANGEIILPTLQECMDDTAKPYAVNGLSRIKDKLSVGCMTMSEFEKRMNEALNNIPLLPILSNPCDADTDGDGLADDVDANPMHVFDQRFINTAEKEDILTNNNINNLMAAADASYNTMPLIERIDKLVRLSNKSSLVLYNAIGGGLAGLPNARNFLLHFLGNTGEEYIYDASYVFCNIINCKKNICENINAVLNLCEDTVIEDLYFITNPEEKFQGASLSSDLVVGEDMSVVNWWLSIGNTDATMSFHCMKEGDTYTAEIDYHFVDVYDFESDYEKLAGVGITDGDMHELHEAGLAREYKSVGNYSFKITWTKGERIDENFSIEDNEIYLSQ